jgi:hypothetical protein
MSSSSVPLQIYFCASIRAGRQDADLYRIIIDKLRTYGRVLTEHIADTAPWDASHLTGIILITFIIIIYSFCIRSK